MKEKHYSIGKSMERVDALSKIRGDTHFITDVYVDRMTYAYPIYSSVPFARITGIELPENLGQYGFLNMVLPVHIPGINQVGVIIEDQPLLADGIVRFVGDVIGVIISESQSGARKLASLVNVNYEEFSPCLSINESKNRKDNFIHDSNIACEHKVIKGDIEAGFVQSDVIIEADFKTPYQEHFYLEPQGCIAIPEPDGGVTIHGSLQCPFYVQKAVAKVLDVPYAKVRVIQAPLGGAFGGKEDIPSEICARAALAAIIVNRPVKMVYKREDDVQLTSKRHPFQMHYKVGVSQSGKLIAAEIELEENAGAYATLSSVVSYRATIHAMGPYVIPNIKVNSTAWYTNLPPAGAFRGFGAPQATFGHERMMDVIADRLGVDPVKLRLMNILKPGDDTQTSQTISVSVGVEETIKRAATAADWNVAKKKKNESERYIEGMGIATCHYGNCLGAAGWILDGAGAKIQISRDGSISVSYGLAEMGQGSLTAVTQMTAEALGVSPHRITVTQTDTQNIPDSGPSVASRNVVMTGNAIRNAAEQLRPIMKTAAAKMLDCCESDVKISNDNIRDTKSGNEVNFSALADYLYTSNCQMDMLGWWHVPKLDFNPETGQGEAYFTYSYATHVAQVRVDKLTGLVKVLKIWAAHDVGKAINPAGLEAQVEGGTMQGIGWALTEHFQYEGGKVTTSNMSTYLLPTAKDSTDVETIIVEDTEPEGPWGAKGIGEPAIIPTAAAIANAVSNALGKQINEIPIYPEKVLDMIASKR